MPRGITAFLASDEARNITGQILRERRPCLFRPAGRSGAFAAGRAGSKSTKEDHLMTLEEKVIAIIMEQLEVTKEECKPEAAFIEDLGADSLDLVELIMEMEENFGLQISDDDLAKIRTIGDVIAYMKSKGIS